MAEYKWECVHDWLREYIGEIEKPHVFHFLIMELANKLDHDTLQDIFEEAMSEDGFFDPIVRGIPLSEHDGYEEGWEAAEIGQLEDDNPFPENSEQYADWIQGYKDWYAGEEPL